MGPFELSGSAPSVGADTPAALPWNHGVPQRPTGQHDDGVDPQPPLVGRAEELAALREHLERARSGTGAALVLAGEAGIGKTSLLQWCAAEAAGFLVLGTRGTPSEQHLSHVGLYDVLAPLLPTLDGLDPRHAAVIRGALALGPPVSAPPLELVVAVLGLLSAAAATSPVLLVVDDAQWVDDSTLSCLTVVARRLHSEGVLALFGTRPLGPHEPPRSAALASLPTMPVPRLSPPDSAALLAAVRPDAVRDIGETVLREAGGNPLAIVVLGRRRDARAATTDAVDLRLGQAFAHELDQLSPRARHALELMAVVGETTTTRLRRALDEVGLGVQDLDPAEELDLVRRAEGRVVFTHPLVRAAVASSLGRAQLRDLHRVAAQTLDGAEAPTDVERRLWHLADATDGPDDDLAVQLERLATDAVTRSSPASAVRLLERAALLTTDPRTRTERLLRAADLLQVAGLVADSERVLAAAAEGADPVQTLVLEHRRARFQAWSGRPGRGRDALMLLAASCRTRLPREAVTMYGHAVLYSTALGEFDRAAEAVAQVDALSAPPATPVPGAEAAAALLDHFQARPAQARRRLARCAAELDLADPLSTEQIVLIVALCRFLDDDAPEGLRILDEATAAARRAGAVGLLPFQLSRLAVMRLIAGEWSRALTASDEALQLAELNGWVTEVPFALTWLARVEAALGRGEDCREHVRRAIAVQGSTAAVVAAYADLALGTLHLGQGDPGAAVPHLESVAAFAREHDVPDNAFLPWGGDLLECYARTGRLSEARALVRELRPTAEAAGRAELACALLRGDALVEQRDDRALALFAAAEERAVRAGADFERARTALCRAEHQRRHHRVGDAEQALTAALATFQRLGAAGWSAQVREQLAAIGSHTPEVRAGLGALTAQELTIADLVATGASNQQVADRLFLSVRTVEFHLSSVYRKLGLQRRTQLVRLVSGGTLA